MHSSQNLQSRIGLLVEAFGPITLSVAAVVAVYYKSDVICDNFSKDLWKTSDLYAAVFNWSAIQIGFAFGVYGFVVGKSDGFIEAVRETHAMRKFIGYVQRANVGGFLLTILSFPLTITNPSPSEIGSLAFYYILAWFGLFIWTFLAFLRIAFNFGRLSSVKAERPFYGA